MPQQPQPTLFALNSPPTPGASQPPATSARPAYASVPQVASAAQPEQPEPQRIPRWLVRTELFLRVVLQINIGLAVCCVPWNRIFWDQNPLFLHFPTLAAFATNGAVRGMVSGLGLLNLWIALQDALHREKD